MKKITKILSMLLISILSVVIMTGCGKIDPPETVAQGFFDLIVYSDTTKLESLGVSAEEFSTVKDFMRQGIKESIRNNFKMAGLSITEENLDAITEAQLNALKKVKATITTESSDKQTAVVKIQTNYLKLTEADEKAANEVLEEVQAMGLTDRQEILNVYSEKYTAKLIETLNAIEPVDDTVEKSFSFVIEKVDIDGKSKDMWIPENPTTLGKDISTMIAQ